MRNNEEILGKLAIMGSKYPSFTGEKTQNYISSSASNILAKSKGLIEVNTVVKNNDIKDTYTQIAA